MKNSHNIYLISDSTGETLDRIFLALKAQFENFDYKINQFSFTRTETQIKKIIESAEKNKNSIILYTIVNSKLAKFLSDLSAKKKNSLFWSSGRTHIKFFKIIKSKGIP